MEQTEKINWLDRIYVIEEPGHLPCLIVAPDLDKAKLIYQSVIQQLPNLKEKWQNAEKAAQAAANVSPLTPSPGGASDSNGN